MIKHFPLNEIGRDFVAGDIHGCFNALQEGLDKVDFNTDTDRLFCVGDLVDRGPDSENVVEWFNKSWFHSVRGNHEQMAIDTFLGEWDAGNYFANGGQWFLGLTHEEQALYVDMFESMPIMIEVETKSGPIGIVHAEYTLRDWHDKEHCPIGNEWHKSFRAACLWSRDRISFGDESFVKGIDWIYCGHTPVPDKKALGNTLYIDTGLVFGNKLTLIEI
jgi:serine/threonine protein phosphatase 1